MSKLNHIDALADALRRYAGRSRAWAKLTDGERRQWRIRARMIADGARRQWPDDFDRAPGAGGPPQRFDTAEFQTAKGTLELSGGERPILDPETKRIVRHQVTENVRSCPLMFYAERRYITGHQRDAGLQLMTWRLQSRSADGLKAAALDPDRVDNSLMLADSEIALHAAEQLRAAESAVGRQLWPALYAVCIEEISAKEYAKRAGVNPPAAGMVVLRLALDALLDHIGKRKGR